MKRDGWLVMDKPLGMTSNQLVGKCRWLTKAQKVGHGGTLDPLASGILPLAFGEATKVIPFIMDARKTYEFTVCFGEARATDDREGLVTATSPVRPNATEITAILPEFIGDIIQTPPAYSAIKIDGQRAYALARAGHDVVMKSRPVTVFSLDLLSCSGDAAAFRVVCGKGTYVRALARDMALRLNTLGYVSALRRTRVGPFGLSQSISLEKLEELGHSAPPEAWLLPVVTVLDDILALAVTEKDAADLSHGRGLQTSDFPALPPTTEMVRAMQGDRLVALCKIEATMIRPVRVFNI